MYDAGSGSFDAEDTVNVVDTNGDGIRDTGRLNPNDSKLIWVYRTITTTGSVATNWSATSVAQASADGGIQTVATTSNGVTGSVTPSPTATPTPTTPATDCTTSVPDPTPTASAGFTKTTYYLHNLATPANSTAQVVLDMTKSAPTTTTLYNYSTDVATGSSGRTLTTGGTFASGTAAGRGDWRYPVGKKAFSGTATLSLWVAPPVAATASDVNLTAYVYTWVKSGSSYTATAIATIPLTASPFTCTGFQKVSGVSAAFTQAQLANNSEVGVRIVNTGTAPVRLAYDVTGLYPANLVLPEK